MITSRKKNLFTPEEDKILFGAATTFNERNWQLISSFLPGRTAKQCRDRYNNYLNPKLVNCEWTSKEDEMLLKLTANFGYKWSIISQFFPHRSQISIKNRLSFLDRTNSQQAYISNEQNTKYDQQNLHDTYQENSACSICNQSTNFAEITSLWDSSEIDSDNLILSNDSDVIFEHETPDASIFTFF